MLRYYLVFLFISVCSFSGVCQTSFSNQDLTLGLIVKLIQPSDLELLDQKYIQENTHLQIKKLGTDALFYLINSNSNKELIRLKTELKNEAFVDYIEMDEWVSGSRNCVPDDEFYFDQYNLISMQMSELWCDLNEGKTVAGDEVVIAVIESQNNLLLHEDLTDNLWTNPGEIQDDGLDNDGNGYVDDYYGIQAVSLVGTNLESGQANHGLGVNGVISAIGDNGIGISGISPRTKLLNVKGVRRLSDAIEAYDYIYEMRKAYNDSDGDIGAYIVSANSSFGWDTLRYNDAIALCEKFDRLREVGVLSVAAVRNDDVNIDLEGDIPGLCPSDGLITVNNINSGDNREASGYSEDNVDISAYGFNLFLLKENDGYYNSNGTSFSAPQVAGLIGLLHTRACSKFIDLAKERPIESVDIMKNFILNKALPISSQSRRTATEGKLDPLGVSSALDFYCESEEKDLAIKRIIAGENNDTQIIFELHKVGNVQFSIYNMLGQLIFQDTKFYGFDQVFINEYNFSNLEAGVYYVKLDNEGQTTSAGFSTFRLTN